MAYSSNKALHTLSGFWPSLRLLLLVRPKVRSRAAGKTSDIVVRIGSGGFFTFMLQ